MFCDLERVALACVAAVEATAEPAHALCARTMRVVVGVGVTERVIADGVGGVDGFFQVLVRNGEGVARRVTPNTREAVRLELDSHGVLILALAASRLSRCADQVLHVMPDLVRDDVGLGEVARGAQALFHYGVKTRIDVEFSIARAVKWSDRGGCVAASGRH